MAKDVRKAEFGLVGLLDEEGKVIRTLRVLKK